MLKTIDSQNLTYRVQVYTGTASFINQLYRIEQSWTGTEETINFTAGLQQRKKL